jgi:hypothetical protein
MEDRLAMEKSRFRKTALPGWIFLRFSTAISVLLYSQTIFFDSFGNFRVFSILICQFYAYSSFWS